MNALVDRTVEQYLDSGDLSMLVIDEKSKSEEVDPNLMSFRSGKDLQIQRQSRQNSIASNFSQGQQTNFQNLASMTISGSRDIQ